MKKTINIKRIIIGVAAAVGAALLPSVSSMAWGPRRATFTNQSPASYVTFNSITNNAGVGDERNFVRIKEVGASDTERLDIITVVPGRTYEVYIYYHNNAASNLNLTATNARVYSYFPSVINKDMPGNVGATISADNATPERVWDEAKLRTDSEAGVMLKYVENSAKIHNAGATNLNTLSENLFAVGGTWIGYDALDGKLPGCAEYSGYITYELKAEQAVAYLSKMASKDGNYFFDDDENVEFTVGDVVTYKVVGKNKGTAELDVTSVHDLLAPGLEPVGPAVLTAVNTATGQPVSMQLNSFFTPSGNGGWGLAVGGEGWTITYQAKVTEAALGGKSCGKNKLVNGAYMSYALTSNPTIANVISNHAAINVNVACPDEVDEMPKTGADAGEMIMTMMIVISGMGGVAYMAHGMRMMRREEEQVEQQPGQPEQMQ